MSSLFFFGRGIASKFILFFALQCAGLFYSSTADAQTAKEATCPSNPPGFVDFNFTTPTNLTGSGIGRTWTYENAINYLGEEVDILSLIHI